MEHAHTLNQYTLRVETKDLQMIIRALRQYNAYLAILQCNKVKDVPHQHGEPWALAESLEQSTGVAVPKQLAYMS